MDYIKNLSNEVSNVSDLISIKENQVISKALTKTKKSDVRLFSLSMGEEINNEKYEMDTIYLCLQGVIIVNENNVDKTLSTNDFIAISKDSKSHIIAKENSIMLQIMVGE